MYKFNQKKPSPTAGFSKKTLYSYKDSALSAFDYIKNEPHPTDIR